MLRTTSVSLSVLSAMVFLSARPAPPSSSAPIPEPPAQAIAVKHTLTLDGANRALAAAINLATERHAGGAIAVVDDGGNLIALQRLDGTFAAGATVSIGKARTAALFK